MEYVKDLAQRYQLNDRLDWDKVPAILKAREGIAQEVTKDPPAPLPSAPSGETANPREVRLSPLQDQKPTVE
jgi:hypothetical protein